MSEVLTKVVVDCSNGEVSYIPLTPEEIQERELMAAQAEQERLEREAADQAKAELRASAKAKLIAGLPMTEEEADTLLN